jgi:hypothetical protein
MRHVTRNNGQRYRCLSSPFPRGRSRTIPDRKREQGRRRTAAHRARTYERRDVADPYFKLAGRLSESDRDRVFSLLLQWEWQRLQRLRSGQQVLPIQVLGELEAQEQLELDLWELATGERRASLRRIERLGLQAWLWERYERHLEPRRWPQPPDLRQGSPKKKR